MELVEIPTDEEIHDNIVSYWVPALHAAAAQAVHASPICCRPTRIAPQWSPGGRVIATRTAVAHGRGSGDASRRILIDFAGGDLDYARPARSRSRPRSAPTTATSTTSRSSGWSENGVWRVTFRLLPKSNQAVDLRCYLTLYGEALTETWTYLWTP